ncbi:MAG TPA: type IV secretion system protein [Solirubrobacteraceae bacterium]|nr:type IV secretion system protein [Solirubrobacteraceae bacterium]
MAAPAPTGNYGIDVHIDTGLLGGFSSGGLLSAVQDLFVTPLWMALVWSMHALVVMLEWCFTVDLLDSAAAGGLARGLRQAQMALTDPWLPLVLAVASVLALYHGLIRRRVAATLGEAVVMVAMMAGGIWVIADPTSTVGALGQWANQAALGTLAVAARGAPSAPGQALGESLDVVFAAAIEAPWCYLEFGDVDWCRNPARLDTGLRTAGLAIAVQERALAHCNADLCRALGGSATAGEHSAELLRDARSNGAIFLALPANGPARNSINDQGSLLRTICRSSEATNCHGPAAAQAQFRTAGQTWARVGGLLLIALGLLGMLLLLGFIAVRLLTAAVFSLLYLLLAPAMVLAPALGEGGRALFRRWVAQLLGAVVSKLLFSFLLGVVLAVLAILADLSAIGWWTQWLLMSAFWWGAYTRRHQALGVVGGAMGGEQARHRSVVRRVSDVLETRKANAAVRWIKGRHDRSAPAVEERRRPKPASRAPSQAPPTGTDEQVARMLQGERDDASERVADGAESEQRISALHGRLGRVRLERAKALADGDWRRAVQLGGRSESIEREIERSRGTLEDARQAMSGGSESFARERHEKQERFLNAQAALPGSAARGRAGVGGERRDYSRLAPLAGYAQQEYEQLDPRGRRVARLQIDRELALRNELARSRGDRTTSVTTPVSRRPNSEASNESAPGRRPVEPESSVMRDAREVAAGRKRQLGRDRA